MNNTNAPRRTRRTSAYHRFIQENTPLRPEGVGKQEWFNELRTRWRNRNQQPANTIDMPLTTQECIVCYNDRPIDDFINGPCQHHNQVCITCIPRLPHHCCPVCRFPWDRPPPPPTPIRRQQHAFIDEVLGRATTIWDVADFRDELQANLRHLARQGRLVNTIVNDYIEMVNERLNRIR